jgi:Uma2 family endonuclease
MSTTKSKLLNADDLLRLYGEGINGELVRGVLCKTMPPGRKHGRIQAKLTVRLGVFIESRKLGFVVGEAGIWLEQNPDTVRAPDIAYFSNQRVPPEDRIDDVGYSEAAPDLLVEVVSPNDTRRAVHDKALMWMQNGVRLVWVVHPDTGTVDVHAEGQAVRTLSEEETLDGLDVLPGFSCLVSEIFEEE